MRPFVDLRSISTPNKQQPHTRTYNIRPHQNQPTNRNKQIARVLRPGGICIQSISNRCFPTKAINLWLETGDQGHVFIVGSYFHYGSKDFEPPVAKDISPGPRTDPLYIVQAAKKKKAA